MSTLDFDIDDLLDYVGGDRVFAAELIDIFIVEATTALHGIKAAATNSDKQALYEHAHALKGGAANIRAVALRDFMQSFSVAIQADSSDLPALLSRLDAEFQRSCEVLTLWQKSVRA